MERTIEAMVAGRRRWLEKMNKAKASEMITKIPTGRRRPRVKSAPSKMIAQARGIASEFLRAHPEPMKPSEEMNLSEVITEVGRLSLMKLLRILDRPAGDDIARERLQARAALLLTKLYFSAASTH
jgi:hypothetical protein